MSHRDRAQVDQCTFAIGVGHVGVEHGPAEWIVVAVERSDGTEHPVTTVLLVLLLLLLLLVLVLVLVLLIHTALRHALSLQQWTQRSRTDH